MLNSRVVAYKGNDEAILRFENKTVLRQVDGDTVLIQEIDERRPTRDQRLYQR